jgi:ubiquinone/menaquinone biosynthesis C-methylase UbiE
MNTVVHASDRIRRRFDGSYGVLYDGLVSRPAGLRMLSVAFGFDQVLVAIPRLVRDACGDAPAERLLDVPCGAFGSLAHGAGMERTGEVVGIDLAETMVSRARARVGTMAGGLDFPVRVERGDALHLPFEDASFGAALSVNGLHCMPDHARFLAEVARVMRPGGSFTLTTLVDRGSLHSRSVNGALTRAHVLPGTPPSVEALDAMLDAAGFGVDERLDGRLFVARRCVRR